MTRMSRGTGEMEEHLLEFDHRLRKKRTNLASFMNLMLLLIGVYVALFIESIARWLLLLAIIAVYFFQDMNKGG